MMHNISHFMDNYDCYFTPYYSDGIIYKASTTGFLDFSILGGTFRINTEKYLSGIRRQNGGIARAVKIFLSTGD